MTAYWFLFMAVFISLGLPISVALGLAAGIALLLGGKLSLSLMPIMIYNAVDSFLLIAVPFFMLTGYLMEGGGISRRIFDFANSLVGWIPGGLGHVTVASSMIFGGISGSGSADAAGLAPVQVSAMVRHKYPLNYSAAIAAAAATMAPVIPPSIIMVVYAVAASQPAVKALVAGLGPGVFIGLSLMALNFWMTQRRGWHQHEPFRLGSVAKRGKSAFLALMTPVILMGGMLSGFFTPTEASVIAVLYSFVIAIFVYREMRISDIPKYLVKTGRISGVALFIVCTASLSAFILTSEQVPQKFAQFILSITDNKVIILLGLNFLLLIAGCFMESIAIIIVTVPMLMPIVKAIGVDPVHFGAIMITNLALGMITPPVGVILFVTCSVIGVKFDALVREIAPFTVVIVLALLAITFVPEISMTIPNLLWPAK